MGEENTTPRSDRENPKETFETGDAHIGDPGASAGNEATLGTIEINAVAMSAGAQLSIGPYVLVKKLGEGGMGQVWLAQQTAPVKRQVAVKLIKGGLYDNSVILRFESERQSLAVMNHPTIAKVFDAGSTEGGQPYFVMEYVDGPPITRYCDNKKLKIRERLELFIKVCEGVQHAHQRAIIHRDLKPSNVLVAGVDGKATPRIIDFGIAKAISSQPGSEQTQITEMGALMGTRGFISPEQADPNVFDVDTRTDVYSLGALLYVMLTGMLPFDSEGEKKKPIDELLRQLREEDPPTPSTKINTQKEIATAAAELRGIETRQLVKLLRGDLDWITVKALEKDRGRRYGSPAELAADLERYLENRPVVARPATTVYRVRKYIQRHRVGVAAVSGALALLVAFAITQAVQIRRITRERDRANRIADFMTNMFKESDTIAGRGNVVTASQILDRGSKDINARLANDPELQAQMMEMMGILYDNLGHDPEAESLVARAVEIRRRDLGPKDPNTLSAEQQLGWVLFREGRYHEAETVLRHMLDDGHNVLDPANITMMAGTEALGVTLNLEGRYSEAEKLERQAFDLEKRTLGPEHPYTVQAMDDLAHVLASEGQLAEAESLYRQTLDIHRRVNGADHRVTLLTMNNLSLVLSDEGHTADAEKLLREAVDTARRVLGPENPDTAFFMNHLANILSDEHRYSEAEKMNQDTLEIRRRIFGPDHPETASSVYNLACIAALTGRSHDAFSLLNQAVDHGLSPDLARGLEKDTDLNSLHGDPRFAALVVHAKERAAAPKRPN